MSTVTIADLLIKLRAEFGDEQAMLDSLRATAARMNDVEAQTKAAGAAINAMGQQSAQGTASQQAFGAATVQAGQNVNTFTQQVGQAAQGIGAMGQQAAQAVVTTQALGAATAQTGQAIQQATNAAASGSQVMANLAGGFGILETAAGRLGQVLEQTLLYGLSFQALSEIENIIRDTAGVFEDAASKITGATGAVGPELDKYRESLSKVLETAVQAAPEVGSAMGQIASAFHIGPGEELENITRVVLNVAKITGESVDTIVKGMGQVERAFKIDPADFERVMTRIVTVSQDTGIKVSELQTMLIRFQGVFKDLNVPVENAVQFLGKLSNRGLDVAGTMTALQQAMEKLGKGGAANLSDAMDQLFKRIQDGTAGPMTGFNAASKVFEEHTANMAAAIQKGQISVDQFYASLDPLHASLQTQADSMRTLGDSWQKLEDRISKSNIGKITTDAAKLAIAAIDDLVTAVDRALSQPVDPNAGFMGYLSRAADAIGAVSIGVASLTSMIGDDFTSMSQTVSSALAPAIEYVQKLLAPLQKTYETIRDIILLKPPGSDGGSSAGLSAGQAFAGSFGTNVGLNFPMLGGSASGAGNAASSAYSFVTGGEAAYRAAASAAERTKDAEVVNKLTADKTNQQDAEYKQLKAQVEGLARRFDAKQDVDFLRYELSYYNSVKSNPDEIAQAYKEAAEITKELSFDAARGVLREDTDSQLERLGDLLTKIQTAGMGTKQALDQLGLKDPAQLQNQISLLATAFDVLTEKGGRSTAFVTNAYSDMVNKMVADTKAVGEAVSSQLATLQQYEAAQVAIANMNNVNAAQFLGITTTGAAGNQTAIAAAALASIQQGRAVGLNTDQDVLNAQIAELQAEEKAARATGVAFDDLKQSVLDLMIATRQANALNTEGAFRALGLPSTDDLENYQKVLDAAFAKIRDASAEIDSNIDESQVNQARIDQLQKLIAAYKQAGKQINDDWITEMQDLQARNAEILATVQTAIQNLGVTTTKVATDMVEQAGRNMQLIAEKYGQGSSELLVAQVNGYKQQIDLLARSGQTISDDLVRKYDAAAAALKARTLTIDQAYQQLSVQSASAVQDRLTILSAALAKIEADGQASSFTRMQAEVAYATQYYQSRIALGQEFSEKDKALNDLMAARVKAMLDDQYNKYKATAQAIADIYHTLQDDISSGITGIINGTSSVSDAFLKMGQDIEQIIVKYIIKNFLLTEDHLNTIQQGFLQLLGAKKQVQDAGINVPTPGLGGGGGGGGGNGGINFPTGGGGNGGVVGDGFDEASGGDPFAGAQAGAGASGSSGSGLLSSLGGLSGILNIANLGVNILSGIVSGVQQAHANNLLDLIEKSTRFTWIATGEADDSISHTNKTIMQKVSSLLDFANGDLRQYLQNINSDLDNIAGHLGSVQVNYNLDLNGVISMLANIYNAIVSLSSIDNAILQQITLLQSIGSENARGTSEAAAASIHSATAQAENTSAVMSLAHSMASMTNAITDAAAATGDAVNSFANYKYQQPTVTANDGVVTYSPTVGNPISFGASGGTQTSTPVPTNQLPGYDAGVPGGSNKLPVNVDANGLPIGTDSILNNIYNQLRTQSAFGQNDKIINLLQAEGQTQSGGEQSAAIQGAFQGLNLLLAYLPDLFQSGTYTTGGKFLPTVGGPTGYTVDTLNQAYGLKLTQADFDNLFIPAVEARLQDKLPDAATLRTMTRDQLRDAVGSALNSEFFDAFISSLPPELRQQSYGTAGLGYTPSTAGSGVAAAAAAYSDPIQQASVQVTGGGLKMADALYSAAANVSAYVPSTGGGVKGGQYTIWDKLAQVAAAQANNGIAPFTDLGTAIGQLPAAQVTQNKTISVTLTGNNFSNMSASDIAKQLVSQLQAAGIGR